MIKIDANGRHDQIDQMNKADSLPVLIFKLAKQRYGIPITNVVQIVEFVTFTVIPNTPKFVPGVINYRGAIVPIFDLRLRFGLPFMAYGLHTPIMLVDVNGRIVGLIVDLVEEVIEINTANLESNDSIIPPGLTSVSQNSYLSSIAKLGHQLVLMVEPDALLTPNEQTELLTAIDENEELIAEHQTALANLEGEYS